MAASENTPLIKPIIKKSQQDTLSPPPRDNQQTFGRTTVKKDGISIRRAMQPSASATSLNTCPEDALYRSPSPSNSTILSINSTSSLGSITATGLHHRYRLYTRLSPGPNNRFLMPNHVVPSEFFVFLPFPKLTGKQNSLITIFSIWNTMMGTSILSIPWGIQQAGFSCGIGVMILMACLAFYTAYRVLNSVNHPDLPDGITDFSEVCQHYFGRIGQWSATVFSLISLLGAIVVYYVLLTNFLFNSVDFIHNKIVFGNVNHYRTEVHNHNLTDVFCPAGVFPPYNIHNGKNMTNISREFSDIAMPTGNPKPINTTTTPLYRRLWSQQLTVPFWLLLLVAPIISIKSPTFFSKFTALGTLSVVYLVTFVVFKASHWGINMDFQSNDTHLMVPEFRPTFVSLSGICALAFYIHNCVISLMSIQKNPQNNARDLLIAFVLVLVTYLFVGITYYISFPLPKLCIADNILNNIVPTDTLAFVGRIALFFQMTTVFPLIVYVFRSQLMQVLFKNSYPGFLHVSCLHLVLLGIAIFFAIYVPQIGTIIRFSGALCGCVYMFTLPVLVYIKSSDCNIISKLFHCGLILLGFTNLIGQFIFL